MGTGLSDKNNWLAAIGEHLQGAIDGTEQMVQIDKIVQHPHFACTYILWCYVGGVKWSCVHVWLNPNSTIFFTDIVHVLEKSSVAV